MKKSVAVLLLGVLALAAAVSTVNAVDADSEADAEGETEDEGEAVSTSELDSLVADVLEADAEVADVEQFESEVGQQNVDAEHAELTAEAEAEASHEFETETVDEVEADAMSTDDEEAADHAAAQEVDAAESDEAVDQETAEQMALVEADADADAEDDSEADADADADAESEAGVSMHSAAELASIASATATAMEFAEDTEADEVDDAEDAEARAEEQAFEAARFASAKPLSDAAFDEARAKEMFVYAQAAYFEADPALCVRKLRNDKTKTLRVAHTVTSELVDGATVYGVTGVDTDKRRVVIAFNGNAEPHELSSQLMKGKPFKVKALCKSCKTHRYYVSAYKKVCPQITASVRLLMRKPELAGYPVWITGHGFGGALAQLCAFELEMSRVFTPATEKVVITYGQPRVGNAHWARKFNQHFPSAVRITHSDDPMPHVPPCHVNPDAAGTADAQTCFELKDRKKKLWAFHSPTQIWYASEMPAFDVASDKGSFKVCNGANWGEDPVCRNKPLGLSIDDFRNYYGVDVSSHCANLIDPPANSKGDGDGDQDMSSFDN